MQDLTPSQLEKYSVTFRPESLGEEYSGTVRMRIPSYDERIGFLERFGKTPDEAKEFMADRANSMALGRVLIGMLPDYVVAVDITRVVDTCRLTCFDDIRYESSLAQNLLPELGWWLLGKHQISNPSVPS